MGQYLSTLAKVPDSEKWHNVRQLVFSEPLAFFEELRRECPVLVLPNLTLATRFSDCALILRRHGTFGVDLYQPKQGSYFMAQDDTATHWRDKSIMQAVLDREDVPRIRSWVAVETRKRLLDAGAEIDLVPRISRGIPLAMVEHWFGFEGADALDLKNWSYWNQQDAFWNQPFDADVVVDPALVVREREAANVMLALFLAKSIAKKSIKLKLGFDLDDTASRLLKLYNSGGVKFGLRDVIFNVGGLLIGAVETISHTAVNALNFLLSDPARKASAQEAAQLEDTSLFDAHVFEALRFRPAFPYFFRVCHAATPLSSGTEFETTVKAGNTVLAVTQSAMFDDATFPEANQFIPRRNLEDAFTFGHGIHSCLGKAIAMAVLPEIVRQIFLLPHVNAKGPPDFKGTSVPESWTIALG
jgi:cytochrome P450